MDSEDRVFLKMIADQIRFLEFIISRFGSTEVNLMGTIQALDAAKSSLIKEWAAAEAAVALAAEQGKIEEEK